MESNSVLAYCHVVINSFQVDESATVASFSLQLLIEAVVSLQKSALELNVLTSPYNTSLIVNLNLIGESPSESGNFLL